MNETTGPVRWQTYEHARSVEGQGDFCVVQVGLIQKEGKERWRLQTWMRARRVVEGSDMGTGRYERGGLHEGRKGNKERRKSNNHRESKKKRENASGLLR